MIQSNVSIQSNNAFVDLDRSKQKPGSHGAPAPSPSQTFQTTSFSQNARLQTVPIHDMLNQVAPFFMQLRRDALLKPSFATDGRLEGLGHGR
jgi:hypothetical protein